MNLYNLMEKRRSTRHFSNKMFPKKKIELILEAGLLAPSGADQKPYVYVVIDDPIVKKKIKERCEDVDKKFYANAEEWFQQWIKERNISLEKNFLIDAPYLVIIAGETDKPYWLESTWVSIAYMILAAENEGLATLTYTPAKTDFLRDLIHLPTKSEPVAILPIGFAEKEASKRTIIPKGKVFLNRYGKQYFH